MKRLLFVAAMTVLIFGFPSLSHAGENEGAPPSSHLSQEKKQYEQSMEERLGRVGKQLDEIKAKAATMTEEARKDLNRYLVDAEKKQKKASQKLQHIRKESAKKWKKFASDMDAAMDDFEKSYERAKSHFKE